MTSSGHEGAAPLGWKVRVLSFSKECTACMDKADAFVQLGMGKTMHKPAIKNNAGCAAVFDEVFSFFKDPSHAQLQNVSWPGNL